MASGDDVEPPSVAGARTSGGRLVAAIRGGSDEAVAPATRARRRRPGADVPRLQPGRGPTSPRRFCDGVSNIDARGSVIHAMREFVFAYGSLVAGSDGTDLATLRGFRASWTAAMDNRRLVAGYKVYEDERGERPPVEVCFLDVVADPAAEVRGVLLPVDAPRLARLDLRERSYRREDVSAHVDGDPGRVWTYVGLPEARERASRGRRNGSAVVARPYLDAVSSAMAVVGLAPPPVPDDVTVAELTRRDLPPG